MKEENYTVYYHLNKANGKIYVGATGVSPKKRFQSGYGYRKCRWFEKAIKEFGWDGFHHRIVCDGLSKEQAGIMESNLIRWLNTTEPEHGYNLRFGAGTNEKCSKYRLGNGLKGIGGNSKTVEQRKRAQEVALGRVKTKETNNKISQAMTGKSKKKWQPVMCVETGIVYPTVKEAAESLGFTHGGSISAVCVGRRITAGGYHWRHVV